MVFQNNVLAGASNVIDGLPDQYLINQSIRFNTSDNPFMGRTPSATGTEETWTWSFWIKRGKLGTLQVLFQIGANKNNCDQFYFNSDDELAYNHLDGGSNTDTVITKQLFRDTSAWYHIVLTADTTNAVESERIRIYVNGNRVTDFDGTPNYPEKDTPTDVNTQVLHQIGAQLSATYYSFDGYMAEIVLLDGTSTDCTSFGEFNSSGIWIPKDVSGLTFGTNGFHIKGQSAGPTNAITAKGNIQHSTAQAKIGSSSILFDGNGDLLEVGGSSNWYDFGADGNPWTMEAYIRFDTVSITQKIFWQNNTFIGISYVTGSGIKVQLNNGGPNFTASFSPSINTWYHLAVVRETNNTTTVYIDGTSIGSGTISGGSTASYRVEIGAQSPSTNEFDGYMDEIRISSVARFTSSFTPTTTEYTTDGDTLALIHSNTTDGSTVFKNDVGFGNDSSGNQNNFATPALLVYGQVSDSPTNNFCTGLPIGVGNATGVTFSNGNLDCSTSGTAGNAPASISVDSGKWYYEINFVVIGSGINAGAGETPDGSYHHFALGSAGNQINTNGEDRSFSSDGAGTIAGFKLDIDGGTLEYTTNGTNYSTVEGSLTADTAYAPYMRIGASNGRGVFNFGQDSTFGGLVTAGGNSDSNGIGNFFYSVPSGFKALCTTNLGS